MNNPSINVQLSSDAALVLFEFLDRHRQHGEVDIAHGAENRALWLLRCQLESQLLEPFRSEYDALLEAARRSLLNSPSAV